MIWPLSHWTLNLVIYHLPSDFDLSNGSDVDLYTLEVAVRIVLIGAKTETWHNFTIHSHNRENHTIYISQEQTTFPILSFGKKQWDLVFRIITICPQRWRALRMYTNHSTLPRKVLHLEALQRWKEANTLVRINQRALNWVCVSNFYLRQILLLLGISRSVLFKLKMTAQSTPDFPR